jgi:Flp pilus assembly protein TadD
LGELQKAVSLDPHSLSANIFLALYWRRQGQFDQALAALGQAASLEPQNPILQVEIGDTLAAAGNPEAAVRAYEQAISLAPEDTTYLRLMALFSLKYGYRIGDIALPAARQAILKAPSKAENQDLMAQVLMNQNDLVNAQRFLSQALQIDPGYAEAHLHLGLLYLLQDDKQAARQQLELVASLAPETPTAGEAQRLLKSSFP